MLKTLKIASRLRSFGFALKGVYSFVRREPNAWIHITAAVLCTAAGLFFGIARWEWAILALCFGLVLAAEAINTALERLVDLVSPEWHPIAGEVKDIAAAAVLICALATIGAGAAIFLPHLWRLIVR